jgi:hypothetical protein
MPEVAKSMTNVYYDTAASPFLYSKKIYAIASEMVGVGKILFGTDFPLLLPGRYFQELEASGLSIEDRCPTYCLMKVDFPSARRVPSSLTTRLFALINLLFTSTTSP